MDQLRSRRFDLLVIGGGITGAGIALDAAVRGLQVALIERYDFASGTSSKSSKLVHGGLRYLETRDLRLVREAVGERELLARLAPNLVTPLEFYWGRWAGAGRKASIGLSFYDSFAGAKGMGKHRAVSVEETSELVPGCRSASDGFIYFDAQTDDVRLTLAVLHAARGAGAVVCNYVSADDLLTGTGQVHGVQASDRVGGEAFEILAQDVINATGVWADLIGDEDDHDPGWRLEPSKGVHLVLPRSALDLRTAVLFPSLEGGLIFALPWRSSVLVGTTDDLFTGDLDSPSVTEGEASYLLDSLAASFEGDLDENKLSGAYAGLRPLLASKVGKKTRDLSRQHRVFRGPSGLITVTGGKLTTYRLMAKEALDLLAESQGRNSISTTHEIGLGGIAVAPSELEGIDPEAAASLISSYGASSRDLLALSTETGTGRISDPLPYLEAEVAWAMQQEMAVYPEDVLSRRTRISIESRDAGRSSRARIIGLMAAHKDPGQDPVDLEAAFDRYLEKLDHERGPIFRS